LNVASNGSIRPRAASDGVAKLRRSHVSPTAAPAAMVTPPSTPISRNAGPRLAPEIGALGCCVTCTLALRRRRASSSTRVPASRVVNCR
jgi:hypothetical protein